MALTERKKSKIFSLISGIISGTLIAIAVNFLFPEIINDMEKVSYDLRYLYLFNIKRSEDNIEDLNRAQISSKANADTKIIEGINIVDVDEYSMKKLGLYFKWPRSYHSRVVDVLSEGGSSAIVFDIMFKTADFGKRRASEALKILSDASVDTSQLKYHDIFKSGYNDDSILVQTVKKSGRVIGSALLNKPIAYNNQSEWIDQAGLDRHYSLNAESSVLLKESLRKNFPSLPIMDNIFSEFAKAVSSMGLVNVVPDNDGVHRSLPLFYNFPQSDFSRENLSFTYPVISLQASLHVLGKTMSGIKVVPGEYVDIGPPLRITRDKGALQVSYPNLTMAMIEQIIHARDKIRMVGKDDFNFLKLTIPIIVSRDEDGELEVEVGVGNYLSQELVELLLERELNETELRKFSPDNPYLLSEKFSIFPNSDEQEGFSILDREEDEEFKIDPQSLKIIKKYLTEELLQSIPPGSNKIVSSYITLSYDKSADRLNCPILILTREVLNSLTSTGLQSIEDLSEGGELSFGRNIKIPIDDHGRMLLNYLGKGKGYAKKRSLGTFRYHSWRDVMEERLDPTVYQGKIFLLGSSAAALFDIVSAPFDEQYPGVEIHATAIHNILTNHFMKKMGREKTLLILIIIGILVGIIFHFLPFSWSLTIVITSGILYTIISFVLFNQHYWIDLVRPELTLFLSFLVMVIIRYFFEQKDKHFINNAFKNYISPALIDQMIEHGSKPSLGGKEEILTAFFTDIQGFSTISEKLNSPTRLVELLNEYLSAMTDILLENEGTLDKYEGDAIVAFFGAPLRLDNHGSLACLTALKLQDRLGELRKKWRSEQDKWPPIVLNMRMRIGINTGPIVTGNMGSNLRMNYTMMGDAVNVSARLESISKQYGVYIMVSENTLAETSDDFIVRELDLIKVVGKSEPVKIFELLGTEDSETPDLSRCIKFWNKGLAFYRKKKWDSAIPCFEESLKLEPNHPDNHKGCMTTPSQVFINRCKHFKSHPDILPENWDTVFTASEK